jgi:hypothetical protein
VHAFKILVSSTKSCLLTKNSSEDHNFVHGTCTISSNTANTVAMASSHPPLVVCILPVWKVDDLSFLAGRGARCGKTFHLANVSAKLKLFKFFFSIVVEKFSFQLFVLIWDFITIPLYLLIQMPWRNQAKTSNVFKTLSFTVFNF